MLLLVFQNSFNLDINLHYLVLLPVIWIALRDGLPGAVTATLALSFGATLLSPTASTVLSSAGDLQVFMLVLALTGLVLGALVTQRIRSA